MKDYTCLTDTELVTLFIEGDDSAYKQIYQRYWPILFRHARKMMGNDDEAKDIVQDIFASFWTKRLELKLTSSLSYYLCSATRYRVCDLIDKRKVRNNYLASLQQFLADGAWSPDYKIREQQLTHLIESEIATLPSKMRAVFELSRKDNLSHKEIAAHLNISDQTVKKQVQNAIRILRLKFHFT